MFLGPEYLTRLLTLRSEVNNIPHIAAENNFGFLTTSQINLADVEEYSSTNGLSADLGTVAEAHHDKHDCPMAMTSMIAGSSLPVGFHPGFFFLLEYGVFVTMHKYTVICFCGLMKHGGTPPYAPEGVPVPLWALRLTVIWYASCVFVERLAACNLCCLPVRGKGQTFLLETFPYHTRTAKDYRYAPHTSEKGDFIHQGHRVMPENCLRQFISRDLAVVIQGFLMGLDPSAYMLVDMSRMCSSFYHLEMDGEGTKHIYTEPWDLGPGGDKITERQDILMELKEYYERAASFSPCMLTG